MVKGQGSSQKVAPDVSRLHRHLYSSYLKLPGAHWEGLTATRGVQGQLSKLLITQEHLGVMAPSRYSSTGMAKGGLCLQEGAQSSHSHRGSTQVAAAGSAREGLRLLVLSCL